MLENQRKREAQMKEKEEARRAAEEKEKQDKLKSIEHKLPTASASGVSAAAEAASGKIPPLELYVTRKKNLFAPLPKTERGKPVLLGGDPSGENILYCNGNDVIIRSLDNPLVADLYSEHPRPTTVARYSPDRRFIASGDQTGTVRIWHTEIVQGIPYKLYFEKKCMGGAISDLAWCPESKRIVAVGTGRDTMGIAFFADSGSSAGTISGHSKTIISCDIRPVKPWKVITCSEDLGVGFFEGPPFKWVHTLQEHQRFPNCVRFSPNGNLFISVGQDKLAFFGDAETGKKKSELPSDHQGGIYACSWSPDGQQVLTASGDKTCKVWDVNSGKCVTTFTFGEDVDDQQVGCLWQGKHLVSLSLAGHLSYLDTSSGKVRKVIKGHQKSIESLAYHKGSKSLYTGSYDAVVTRWDATTGDNAQVGGDGHKNSIIGMSVQGDDLHTASMDDTYRLTKQGKDFSGAGTPLGAKPLCLGTSQNTPGLAVVGTFDQKLKVLRGGQIVGTTPITYAPDSAAISADGTRVAIGGEDKEVHLYKLSGSTLSEDGKLTTGHRFPVTAATYSPDGQHLATGDKNGNICVWKVADRSLIVSNKWCFHSAKVNGLEWSPNSQYVASCGLDTSVIIWSLAEVGKRIHIKAAHHGGVTGVRWLDDSTVASVGSDSSLRTWNATWDL